jgi:hypothetical protein
LGKAEIEERRMIVAAATYAELLTPVAAALGQDRKPLLIGFDGRDGGGKTTAANWLAWQLGMPAIHLDLFIKRNECEAPINWRTDDLARCLESRGDRPMIVEGVLLLDVLSELQKTVDFLVFAKKIEPQRSPDRSTDDDLIDPREFSLGNQISRYLSGERRQLSLILSSLGMIRVDDLTVVDERIERTGVPYDRELSAQLAGHVFDARIHFNLVHRTPDAVTGLDDLRTKQDRACRHSHRTTGSVRNARPRFATAR